MIDNVIFFGEKPEQTEIDVFVSSLGSRFTGPPAILAKENESWRNLRQQIEETPVENYISSKVVGLMYGPGTKEEIDKNAIFLHRKTSFNRVIIITKDGDPEIDNEYALLTAKYPRFVLAEFPTADAWKAALDAFDINHPNWDL